MCLKSTKHFPIFIFSGLMDKGNKRGSGILVSKQKSLKKFTGKKTNSNIYVHFHLSAKFTKFTILK